MAPFVVYYRHSAEIVRQSLSPRSHKAICVQTSSKNETHERPLNPGMATFILLKELIRIVVSTVEQCLMPPPPPLLLSTRERSRGRFIIALQL